jgi:hypothetical protein
LLDVALKEWAVVCDLLVEGRLALVLRKGGIHEPGGPGVFELEHRRFLLYPSYAHQSQAMVKPSWRDDVAPMAEPATVTFRGYAEAAGIWVVPSRAALDELDDLHCWTGPQIDLRFGYKPERPLYLVALKAFRLRSPVTVVNSSAYAGCRSWVPLAPGDAVDESGAQAAMDALQLAQLAARVTACFSRQ